MLIKYANAQFHISHHGRSSATSHLRSALPVQGRTTADLGALPGFRTYFSFSRLNAVPWEAGTLARNPCRLGARRLESGPMPDRGYGRGSHPSVSDSKRDPQALAPGPGVHFEFVCISAHSDTVATGASANSRRFRKAFYFGTDGRRLRKVTNCMAVQ